MNESTLQPIKQSARANILVVADTPLILQSLTSILDQDGYHTYTALDPNDALSLLKSVSFAVILCDQIMPTQFFEKAKILQAEAVRLLITSSLEDLSFIKRAQKLGDLDQWISKPLDDLSLKLFVREGVETFFLRKKNLELSAVAIEYQNQLLESHELLTRDLQMAAKVQESLLMGKVPNKVPGYAIAALSIPSKEIDGDFFDFYDFFTGLLDLSLGDAMGKGISAALVATAVKTQLLRFAKPLQRTQVLTQNGGWEEDLFSPEEILKQLQGEMAQKLIDLEVFVNLFYGRFNLYKHTFSYVDCGAMKPLHLSKRKQIVSELVGDHTPLGGKKENLFKSRQVYFEEGDLFIFYSDGLTNCLSPTGVAFGIDRLKDLLKENEGQSVDEILTTIKNAILKFTKKVHLEDDLTLLGVRIEALPAELKTYPFFKIEFQSDLSQLTAVRQFVNKTCENVPGDALKLARILELAVNEAFINIHEHGYNGTSGNKVKIVIEKGNEGLTVDLADQGEAFDPKLINNPNFAGEMDRGFGCYIISEIADLLTYTPKAVDEGWNHLRIFKKYFLKEDAMEIEKRVIEDILVLVPIVESLDAKQASAFKEKALGHIEKHKKKHLVLDLKHLQFIDSSGLSTFLSLLRKLKSRQGSLKLASLNKPVLSLLEIVTMDKIFEIYPTQEEALSSYKAIR